MNRKTQREAWRRARCRARDSPDRDQDRDHKSAGAKNGRKGNTVRSTLDMRRSMNTAGELVEWCHPSAASKKPKSCASAT